MRTAAVACTNCLLQQCPTRQAQLSFSTFYWLNVLYIKRSSTWKWNQDFLHLRVRLGTKGASNTVGLLLSWGLGDDSRAPPAPHVAECWTLWLAFPWGHCWLLCSFRVGGNSEPNLTFNFLYYFFSRSAPNWNAKWKMSVRRKLLFLVLISVKFCLVYAVGQAGGSVEDFCSLAVCKDWDRNPELQNAHLFHLSRKENCSHGITNSRHPLFWGRQARWGDVASILPFITLNISERRAALQPAELHLAELQLPVFIAGHYSPWQLEKEEDSLKNIQHGPVGTGLL